MKQKCYLLFSVGLLLMTVLIFQVFFRYERFEIGVIDLKHDRLTSKIYFRSVAALKDKPQKEWTKLDFKDFRLAKVWAFQNQVFAPGISDIETRFDDLESRVEDIESETDDLESRVEDIESETDDLESKIDYIESKIDD